MERIEMLGEPIEISFVDKVSFTEMFPIASKVF